MSRKNKRKKKRWFPLWLKAILSVLIVLLIAVVGVTSYVDYLYSRMNFEKEEDVVKKEEEFELDELEEVEKKEEVLEEEFETENKEEILKLEETKLEEITWDETDVIRKEENVINILIAGEERINDDRGRTDAILIGSLNLDTKSIKLTSLMRDMYVQIPGYSDNKLNAAYHNGGMPLLQDTIEKNFNLELDGYILVDFNAFETIIDKLGGVQIRLSQSEASYLNRTNYITNLWNRNLYGGTVTLNGDQALGYARVRHVSNGSESGDFGRTQRHRILLSAIYNKIIQKPLTEMLTFLPEVLTLVTTNITKEQCIEYATSLFDIKQTELGMLRLPEEGAYKLTTVRGMSVVLPQNLQKNVIALHNFIYEEDKLGEFYLCKMEKRNKKQQETSMNTLELTAY